jgi:hypothetical protein
MINRLLAIQYFLNQCFDSAFSILRLIIWSKFNLKNPLFQANSKSCVILGNGPSLKYSIENHADFILQSDIMCVNLFSTTEYYTRFKPNNYFLLDEAFIDTNHERARVSIEHLVSDTTWSVNLFAPYKFKKSAYFINEIAKNPHIKPIYFNYVIFEGFDWLRFWIYEKGWGMPRSQNVLVAAIYETIYLNYQKICLIGADYTWHENIRLNENNEIIADEAYFYGNKVYRINQSTENPESYMAKQFLSLHKAFKGFEVLARYAHSKNIKIQNASQRSYIDVFEKIVLSENTKA